MTVKFGMIFKDGQKPDFGSIEKSGEREFTLLEADKRLGEPNEISETFINSLIQISRLVYFIQSEK